MATVSPDDAAPSGSIVAGSASFITANDEHSDEGTLARDQLADEPGGLWPAAVTEGSDEA